MGRRTAAGAETGGSLFLNLGASPSNPLCPHELVLRLRDLFVLQNTIHWIKAISIEDDAGLTTSRGHFKPISSPRYLNDCHEYIFHLTPEGKTPIDRLALGVPYADKSNIARWGHTGGRIGAAAGTPGLFRTKPFSAARRSGRIRRHSRCSWRNGASGCRALDESETMLDPFLGIGNSAVAAKRCGVKTLHRLRDRRTISWTRGHGE